MTPSPFSILEKRALNMVGGESTRGSQNKKKKKERIVITTSNPPPLTDKELAEVIKELQDVLSREDREREQRTFYAEFDSGPVVAPSYRRRKKHD